MTDTLPMYQVVQTSDASAYFSLYILNALTRSNNFWHTSEAVYNEYYTE